MKAWMEPKHESVLEAVMEEKGVAISCNLIELYQFMSSTDERHKSAHGLLCHEHILVSFIIENPTIIDSCNRRN
jgi:hypothetical protein